MNYFFILYIFLLFFFFSYQLTFSTNTIENKTLLYCVCAFIYSFIIYLSYSHFHKEGLEIKIESKNGLQPLVDVVSKVVGNREKPNDYKIKNEFELSSKDIIDENYKDIVTNDEDTIYKADLEASMSSNQNLNKDEWIISSPMQKNNYNRVKQKNMYCAADFNTITACCDQPKADVPSEYICGEEKPYCKGYVAFERWGTCEKKGNNTIESFGNITPECKPTSELFSKDSLAGSGGEYSIIGRFGKYIIWNMHNNLQTFAKEKIRMDNAGYSMLLQDNNVPTMGATMFEQYSIQKCILPIVTDFVKKKMPPVQDGNHTTIIFPGNNSYSKTKDSANIIYYTDSPFEWNEQNELTMGNIFFILIDPNY